MGGRREPDGERLTDVGTVNVAQEIDEGRCGQQPIVNLADNMLLLDFLFFRQDNLGAIMLLVAVLDHVVSTLVDIDTGCLFDREHCVL